MKFNVSFMNIVIELGFVSAMNSTNYDLWSKSITSELERREQTPDDMGHYLKAVWTMAENFPNDIIYNKDIMRSAMEYIGRKNALGENLKTTRAVFSKAYGESNIAYLDTANTGMYAFPRSYRTPTKKTTKKKSTKKVLTPKTKQNIKWTENLSMGNINTPELPNTTISLCRLNEEKFIVITKNKTETFTIPLESAQSIAITIENAILQAKKLNWINTAQAQELF